MTTSPRRAEILSTSLEAFKKIQQERASKQTTEDPRGSRPASILSKCGCLGLFINHVMEYWYDLI